MHGKTYKGGKGMKRFNIYKKIAAEIPNMSKSQLKIANHIIKNPHSVPFLTVGKLAQIVEVSEATVVRFANFLGYSGYNELQQIMIDSLEEQLNTVERLEMSRKVYDETEKGIYEIFEDDIKNIQSTMDSINIEEFQKVAHDLLKAEKIFIVANRSAVSLGTFLQYYLEIILGNSELVHSTESAFERIYNVNKHDVVIGISFARYTKSTLDIVTYAKQKEATIVAITDNLLSPIVPYADVSLFSSSQLPSFLDSFVAPLSVINSLITYIGKIKHKEIDQRLEKLEEIWDEYDVFYKK